MKKYAVALIAVMSLSACIVGETEHTIYIDPDGSATWVVLERDMRSNGDSAEKRAREEHGFLNDVRRGAHPVEVAFRRLGAEWVDLRLLRDHRPFSVWTEAHFNSLEELGQELLYQFGVRGVVAMSAEDGVTRLDVVIDVQEFDGEIVDDSVLALLDELSSYRIVLSQGRFVEAEGFEIAEDETAAVVLEPQEGGDDLQEAPLRISLAWTP